MKQRAAPQTRGTFFVVIPAQAGTQFVSPLAVERPARAATARKRHAGRVRGKHKKTLNSWNSCLRRQRQSLLFIRLTCYPYLFQYNQPLGQAAHGRAATGCCFALFLYRFAPWAAELHEIYIFSSFGPIPRGKHARAGIQEHLGEIMPPGEGEDRRPLCHLAGEGAKCHSCVSRNPEKKQLKL